MEEPHLLSCSTTAAASSSRFKPGGDPPPPLDLQLSISLNHAPAERVAALRRARRYGEEKEKGTEPPSGSCVEALKWQAAEQIRLAAMEKAYAERVRELTRREMELAQSEFARARAMWEAAREEAERAEKMKERVSSSSSSSSSACMEITCQNCRHKFTP